MPCYKCANGKYKYGRNGDCQYTLAKCREVEQAIHAQEDKGCGSSKPKPKKKRKPTKKEL